MCRRSISTSQTPRQEEYGEKLILLQRGEVGHTFQYYESAAVYCTLLWQLNDILAVDY